MKMYKFFRNIDDEQPRFYLQVNPQAPSFHIYESQVIEAAKALGCRRIDLITPEKDTFRWWVDK